MNASLLFKAGAKLGEGAIWSTDNQKLYWVDIEGRTFNVYDPVNNDNKVYSTGKRIGTVVPINANTVLVALEDGIATITLTTGAVNYKLDTVIHKTHNQRFNDGKCDPLGRFWVGTLSMDGTKGVSSLYCTGSDFYLHQKINEVSISNGIVWSIDASLMYYIDTPTGQVVQYDFDLQQGSISNKKVILQIDAADGYPDGMTIDSEGMLWIALWDGFGVLRVNPADGSILQKIDVPAPKVTSCAFGGPNLDQLYITTASVEMSDDELAAYPLSGSLFVAGVNVKGIKANYFVH